MLKVEVDQVDLKRIIGRITEVQTRIAHAKRITVGQVLSEWQTADLHRKRPFTMRFRRRGAAQTIVRPHSLYEMLRSRGVYLAPTQQRRVVKALRKHLQHPIKGGKKLRLREHHRWSTRPILREEVERKLMPRLQEAMLKQLTWSN